MNSFIKLRTSVGLLFCWISLGLLSCNSEKEILDADALGYTYYTLTVGQQRVYLTDSIYITKAGIVRKDTIRTYILELVRDSFINSLNQTVYELDFLRGPTPGGPWEFVDNGFVIQTSQFMMRSEWGLDFIKLAFPASLYKRWNGNSRINSRSIILIKGEPFEPFSYWNGDSYFIKAIESEKTIGSKVFHDVLTVEECDYEDAINSIYSSTSYSRNLGLVYREFRMLKTQIDDVTIPWDSKAERGIVFKQTLIQ